MFDGFGEACLMEFADDVFRIDGPAGLDDRMNIGGGLVRGKEVRFHLIGQCQGEDPVGDYCDKSKGPAPEHPE